MKIYSIYIKSSYRNNLQALINRDTIINTRFISDSPSLLLLISSWIWLFCHKFWILGIIILIMKSSCILLSEYLVDYKYYISLISLGINLLLYYNSSFLLEKKAQIDGFRLITTIVAKNKEEAQRIFLRDTYVVTKL
ncbi:hypothetical protein [Lyticum sinuosum]|uniref:Uncharacterized protein n=1 Tax=Lyticum sinuosum TaxID=1332059 RepID=A0AAE4VK59_9RICK|nr:hypothetical protein [Lyticum sinuosum]MDZ5761470.1 hypothetical protein [Lyticum sinuosum]